ncbi:MAG: DUF4352 domain-containing protein [Desulfurococcales archaeon]|nr:DUF4352 domain-containing protein [Desulfurococcales archaeon]
MRRGISPVIATVIIVAVAIAISIAVAGWLMGLWGTFGTTEQLQVLPNSTLNTTNTFKICVKNTGSKTATITEIEFVGLDRVTGLAQSVEPGQVTCVTGTLTNSPTAGAQYAVKVYTDSGGVYQGYVVAQTP